MKSKPEVFKKAKDAIKNGDRLMAIDKSLSCNGEGFMPVVWPHHLMDVHGDLWLVRCNDKELWLEESDE